MLKFLCTGAKQFGQKCSSNSATECSGRTYLSFYAVSICEVVAVAAGAQVRGGGVSEELLEQLLPNIVDGLGASASADFRAATLMLLAELSSRTPLGEDFLSGNGPPQMTERLEGFVGRILPMMISYVAEVTSKGGPWANISVCIP